ncbi:prephenate dehydrogenase [Romboutsia sp. CE17]|uniref:prephenate dehydrogenase n=1 Tax=Romboutsia sp. CE17 TaxID=2724150 RepID=UPI001442D72C|nr:prephenate dehydrogenase [Romboutsia sp. CE17]QJA07803.1 prephenate dehydrogenase [Romboutsia sp. CE17]
MKIVIVGLGVIGGSFAMALRESGYNEIYGIDIDEKTIKKAIEMNLIKDGSTNGEYLLKNADLVIISIYPKLIKKFIKENNHNFKDGSIITDTTGIKRLFINEIRDVIPKNVDFIFGHPMAGREKKGLDFASKDVFKNANYILVDTEYNKSKNIDILENIIYSIGFSKIKKVSSQFHDEIISFTSQLPHVLSVALINSDEEGRETGDYIGDSYRDLTRIANINEDLWCELFMGNKENLLNSIDRFINQLYCLKESIENNNDSFLIEQFRKASKRRQKL